MEKKHFKYAVISIRDNAITLEVSENREDLSLQPLYSRLLEDVQVYKSEDNTYHIEGNEIVYRFTMDPLFRFDWDKQPEERSIITKTKKILFFGKTVTIQYVVGWYSLKDRRSFNLEIINQGIIIKYINK